MSFFRSRDETTRTYWNYTFQLTPDHLTSEQCHPLKYSYDTLGEECLNLLNDLSLPEKEEPLPSSPIGDPNEKGDQAHITNADNSDLRPSDLKTPPKKPKRDLYALFEENHAAHPTLQKLWDEVNTVPDWVDWDQIARGQDVFYRYAGPMFVGLTYSSLLAGLGAYRVVEVLARTGGFSTRVALHRLYETTQFVLEVTRCLADIQPASLNPNGGSGFKSCLRVRFLHAAVRQRILKLASTHPSYYSVFKNGIPINDLDSIGTIGTFSAVLVFRALPRQGIFLRPSEIQDYLALWRLVAFYIGCPTDPFITAQSSKTIMETLLMHEVNPSPTSRILASNILSSLSDVPPAYPSRPFLEASARWLNGDDLSDALGLTRHGFLRSLYYKSLVAGQCFFFCGFCYWNRTFESLDRRKLEQMRRLLWMVIVEAKAGLGGEMSLFELKYVPEFGTRTEKEEKVPLEGEEKGLSGKRERRMAVVAVGVVVGVVGCLGWLSWVGVKAVWGALLS